MPDPRFTLISTKLMVPSSGRALMRRHRLERMLTAGLQGPLTVVVSPAGCGKTALVSRWAAEVSRRGTQVGWVSLDAKDDDPFRFWSYVYAALGLTSEPDGTDVRSEDPEDFLVPLSNRLAALDDELVLVLDDVHVLTDARIQRGLRFLLKDQSPFFHLVLTGRETPGFVDDRTIRGDVAEVRAQDLVFDREETAQLLRRLDVSLGEKAQQQLRRRFNGWAVALCLTASWAAGRADPDASVLSLSRADATLSDFVTSNVLAQLPDDTRHFLLATSVLSRLTGPLCDAVAGTTGGAETLRGLERRGLFIDALDADGAWFSYHALFGEILQQELARAHPDLVRDAHQRASAWFAAHGFADEAIGHAVSAEDWPGLRRLLQGEILSIGSQRPLPVLEGWLAQVPPFMTRSPFFLLLHAYMWGQVGRTEEAQDALTQARRLLADPAGATELPWVGGLLLAVGAALARLDGDLLATHGLVDATEDEIDRAGIRGTEQAEMAAAVAANAAAGAMVWHGHLREAELVLARVRRTTDPARIRMHASRLSLEAFVLAERGRLTAAATVADQALRLADDLDLRDMFQSTPATLALARIAFERGEHETAAALLDALAPAVRRHNDRGPQVLVAVLRSRLAGMRKDLDAGFAVVDAVRAWPARWVVPPALAALLDEQEAWLCLLAGDVPAARAVVARLDDLEATAPTVLLARGRAAALVLAAHGRHDEAVRVHLDVATSPTAAGFLPRRVEAFVEAAVAARAGARPSEAVAALGKALTGAQPESLRGPFLREAPAVRPLLLGMESPTELGLLGFRRHLLARLDVPPRAHLAPVTAGGLTDRELGVLRLLGGDLSHAQIAQALELSANTLKTHVRHVYRKLGVSSRGEAVSRGRELELL